MRTCFSAPIVLAITWVVASEARAAPHDAVARLEGCGPPAMAALVATAGVSGVQAITARAPVVDGAGAACTTPVLVLPGGRGRLAARVHVWDADLALLETVPDQPIPPDLDALALPDAPAAAFAARLVHALAGVDPAGRVHVRLGTLDALDPVRGTLTWSDPLGEEPLPGTPLVADDGLLLGVLGQPAAGDGARFVSGVAARALVDQVHEIGTPTASGRTGVWIAHPLGPAGEQAFRDAVRAIRQELLKIGLDSSTWEIRDLGRLPEGPPGTWLPSLRREGATVRASMVVALGAPRPGDEPPPMLLLGMARPPAYGDAATWSQATAGACGERLLHLPGREAGLPDVARAVVALAVADRVSPSEDRRPDDVTLRRAETDAARLARRLDAWRERARGRPEEREIDRTLAVVHVLRGRLLLAAGPSREDGTPLRARDALEAFTTAMDALDPERDPQAWRDAWDLVADVWITRTDADPAIRHKAVLDALRAGSLAPAGREEEAGRDLVHARLLAEVAGPERGATLERARVLLERAVAGLDPVTTPIPWAVAQGSLAAALQALPAPDRSARSREVIAAATAAMSVLRPDLLPWEWAAARNTLGQALLLDPHGERSTNVRLAIHAHESALRVLEDAPVERARTLNLLGMALQAVPDRERPAALTRARAVHREALRLLLQERRYVEWAITHRLLADVVRALPGEEGLAALDALVEAHQRSLDRLDRRALPEAWAWTQVNLGNALVDDPRGDPGPRLRRALAAFDAALKVADPATTADLWTEATAGQGRAWRALPGGDRRDHLQRAEAAFRAAAAARSREADPAGWARLQGELLVTQAWSLALDGSERSPGSAEAAGLVGDACLQEALLSGDQPLSAASRLLLARAEAAYQRALEIDPNDTDALDGLALVRWYAGDAAGAAEAATRLAALLPQDPSVGDSLRLFQWRARVAEDPADVEAWAALAARDLAEGRPGDALEDWARVLALRPADPQALAGSVRVLADRQDGDQASTLVERALAAAPEDPAILAVAARVYLDLAPDPMRAEAVARARAEALPRDAGAAADLATALLVLHRAPEAVAVLDRVLPRLKALTPVDAARVHALRLAAGVEARTVARDLIRSYGATAEGSVVPGPWDHVRRAVALDLPAARRSGVDRALAVLAVPRDARSQDALQQALQALP